MEYVKLDDICNFISRGINYNKDDLANNSKGGYTVEQISFSDINEEGTFSAKKKIILKDKSLYHKYKVSEEHILLPPTIKNSAKARRLYDGKASGLFLDKAVYSSNIVILQLKDDSSYTPLELQLLLNTEKIQQRLINEVYSVGKVKSISIEKLKQFKIPIMTNDIKQALIDNNKYIQKLQKTKEILNNLI